MPSKEYNEGYAAAIEDGAQEPMTQEMIVAGMAIARAEIKRLKESRHALIGIVEGVNGIPHGTFRAETSRQRLKDTPEWVAFYVDAKPSVSCTPKEGEK